jgi:hypothetical protein
VRPRATGRGGETILSCTCLDYPLTLQCCLDLLDGRPYGYAALDLLYSEALHSTLLSHEEKALLLASLDRTRSRGLPAFWDMAWHIADTLETYPEFRPMKVTYFAHVIAR